jgi:hypothetical protein
VHDSYIQIRNRRIGVSDVDPVSASLLSSLAGGAGGEMGKDLWRALSDLVLRPFRSRSGESRLQDSPESGTRELTALQSAPQDVARAQALSAALTSRAGVDPEFAAALSEWTARAQMIRMDGNVFNSVSGGSQRIVIQGRDFTGITFNSAPDPPE